MRRYSACLLTFVLVAAACQIALGEFIYWTEKSQVPTRYVDKFDAAVGVSSRTTVHSSTARSYSGIAVDIGAGKLYYSDLTANTGGIYRSNLDGTSVETVVDMSSYSVFSKAWELELDPGGGLVYFTHFASSGSTPRTIQKVSTTGTFLTPTTVEIVSDGDPYGLVIDPGNGVGYFTDRLDNAISDPRIRKFNLSGAGSPTDLLVLPSGADPAGIDFDVANEWIYWAETGTDKIRRVKPDGTSPQDVFTFTGAARQPHGIVLNPTTTDPTVGKIYFTTVEAPEAIYQGDYGPGGVSNVTPFFFDSGGTLNMEFPAFLDVDSLHEPEPVAFVPEPGALSLLLLAAIGVLFRRRRR